MTTIGLVIIAIITLCYAIRISRTVLTRALLTLVLIVAVLPCTPWPAQVLCGYLQQPFISNASIAWGASNIIVVLGAGLDIPANDHIEANLFSRSRALAGAMAYQECRLKSHDCVVISSGGDPHNTGATEASRIAALLIQLGVPEIDIKLESTSRNTFTNAQNSSKIIREIYPNRKIFITTSSIHMKRSLLYFTHFGLSPAPIVSDWVSPKWGLKSTTYNALLTDFALTEYVGISRYYVYNWVGVNPPKSAAKKIL